jgi:outer membrane protein assembly factor BamB
VTDTPPVLLFVGIKNLVVALDEKHGVEVWRTELRSHDHVAVLWDGESLFAANSGEVWRLEPATGAVLWHNELKGMGRGLTSLASSRQLPVQAMTDLADAIRRRNQQRSAAASAG